MSATGVGKTLPGGRVLFSNLNLAFQAGAKIGVLGLNGAGKSSLLRILAGLDGEHDGAVWAAPGLKRGFLAQEPVLDATRTVGENIADGLAEKTALLADYDSLMAGMATAAPGPELDALLTRAADVQALLDTHDCWNLAHTLATAKAALRVPPDNASVGSLSGGERRRVALCRLLLEGPDVLFLDEPTNHLDAASVAWLEKFLGSYRGTVLAITHDRYFLDNVAGWILEVDRGSAVPLAGNYSTWLARKAGKAVSESRTEAKRQKAMALELEWIRRGPKARQSKSKSRVAAYADAVAKDASAKGAERFLSGAIVIPPAPRLGERVLTTTDLSAATPDGRVLFSGLSFSLPPGAVVGVVGPNGAGKTTLLRMISGEAEPSQGTLEVGASVALGVVSQCRGLLGDGNSRVVDVVGAGSDTVSFGDTEMPVRQYLASFNLVGELATKMVKSLSGGERNRVHLAAVLRTGANLLLLDEPTNDLDVDTLRSLEEALDDYTGCAVIVSHDRYFIDRVCSHLLVFRPRTPGDGGAGAEVVFFEGTWAEYEEAMSREAKEADK